MVARDGARLPIDNPDGGVVHRPFQNAGTTYVNGLASTPLCFPSRSSLFSGRYPHNIGMLGNGLPDAAKAFDQEATIQGYLQAGGYQKAMVGKN